MIYSIGTGLFVGSGKILSEVGPAPLFMGYISQMLVVWCMMNVLGELATFLPMKGITIPYFVQRFVDPSLGFTDGWNYWYTYAMLVGAETTAGAILFEYWDTPVPTAVWITIILVIILLLNIFAVGIFGEAEFWFTSIKLILIVGLVIVMLIIMLGGAPDHDRVGFSYWEHPGSFVDFLVPGSTGKFLAFWMAFIQAGFAYITSPELIALAAGETVSPRRNIPKAARRFTVRLGLFYGLSSLLVGCIVPYTNKHLLNPDSNSNASPFVIGIQLAGIKGLNQVINVAILTSAWSAGNAFVYSGSRILYSLAANGQAPRLFTRTNRKGVPYVAVVATWSVGLLSYLNVSNNGAVVFGWFMNICTVSGFIAWIFILITYLRFRKAMIYRGLLDTLPFRTPLQPYLSYFVLVLLILLSLTNGFYVFFPGQWSASNFLAAYITIPIILGLYAGHKLWFRTRFARRIEDIDVTTGVREMDELAAMDKPRVPRNLLERFWFWLA